MTWDDVRRILAGLPETEEGSSYGTPSFRAGKKFLTRLREPDVIVLLVSFDEREMLMEAEPETFFITDHYRGWPAVLARLSRIHPGTLERLLMQSWRAAALKRMLKAYDERAAKETP